jgi:hypothetical protein
MYQGGSVRILITIFIVTFFSGCTGLPESVSELKTNSHKTFNYTSNLPVNETFELLKSEMAKCYAYDGEMIFPLYGTYLLGSVKSGMFVESSDPNNDKYELALSQKVGVQAKGYLEFVKVTKLGNKTNVEVFPLNSFWERHAERIEIWLNGGSVDDCKIW